MILLNLSAAFDTVDHDISLTELKSIIINGKFLNWFESYLRNRRFKVVIGDEISEEGNMVSGFLQGCILGAILFIIYTTELQYLLQSHGVSCHFYAGFLGFPEIRISSISWLTRDTYL